MPTYGQDASHYDTTPPPARYVAEGFTFMTHKAGGDANDAKLAGWWSTFRPYRGQVLLGAYWVLLGGHDGAAEADRFIARLDSQCPGWRDGPFILQTDAEIWGGVGSTKPSVAACNAFADRLAARMPKLNPIGYLPSWVYGSAVSAYRYPIWASSYVSGAGSASALYPGDNSSRWNAYGGKIPAVLQFTSSATIAGQTTCDANAFRGTRADLTALVAPGWEIETDMAATKDQIDAGRIALAQVFDEAANGSTSTGRNFHQDFNALMAEALKPVLDAVAAADANDPEQMAAAFKAAVTDESQTDIAAAASALKAVLSAAQLAALIAALSPTLAGPATAAEGGDTSIYDETTRAMREQRQPDIEGSGE